MKSRTLIDWIIWASMKIRMIAKKSTFTKNMSHFLANVQRENAENIEKAKGTRGGKTKETIIYEELSRLWKITWKRTIN